MAMRQKEIKAIETEYKGYRFRSRLEARWAVFFDALGIKWEYEKEGYELPCGWYLPDFYLPVHDAYIEIKPTSGFHYSVKCHELSRFLNAMVLQVSGNPYAGEYRISWYYDTPIGDHSGCTPYVFAVGKVSMELWVVADGESEFCLKDFTGKDKFYDERYSAELAEAYRLARSARFEHGESPEFRKDKAAKALEDVKAQMSSIEAMLKGAK
jgi:hypothetical protein